MSTTISVLIPVGMPVYNNSIWAMDKWVSDVKPTGRWRIWDDGKMQIEFIAHVYKRVPTKTFFGLCNSTDIRLVESSVWVNEENIKWFDTFECSKE